MDWLRDNWDNWGRSNGRWNGFRSRMQAVFSRVQRLHPGLLKSNPWRESKRLQVEDSDQNRHWPDEVLVLVVRAATPEFRALLITLLLTGQRIGDVASFTPEQYDAQTKVLRFRQTKTKKLLALHVPKTLSQTFEAMSGRLEDRLLVTPRGRAWTVGNAEEHLLVIRTNLGLPRYTLHGLRATGPTALKMLGFENRAIRMLTGHDSDQNLEVYLRGAASFEMAYQAQEALETRFSDSLSQALDGANERRFSGVTGRAAAQKQVVLQGKARRREAQARDETCKPVTNSKTTPDNSD